MSQDNWCSPGEVAEPLRRFARGRSNSYGYVGLDPCSNDRSLILSRQRFVAGALHLPWRVDGKPTDGYENPPYSRLLAWAEKRRLELELGNLLEWTTLVPVATSTAWWGVTVQCDPLVVFTKRIEFLNEQGVKEQGARFDSVLFLWAKDRNRRREQLSAREELFLECFAPLVRSVVRGRHWTVQKAKARS